MRFRAILAAGMALVLSLAMSPFALAGEQAFTNIIAGSPIYDGFMGNIGIRTDPPTVVGIGYVHAAQVDVGASGGDFLAIGTSNGVGTDNCNDDYDPGWTGYWDGRIANVYICDDFAFDAFHVGDYPTFSIEYKTCPSSGFVNWVMLLSGTVRSCQFMNTTGATRVITLLETTGPGTTDRNIDVRFINLKWNLKGSTVWSNYGNPGAGGVHLAPNYSYEYGSVGSHKIFLAPYE